jgi:hypothetical protein
MLLLLCALAFAGENDDVHVIEEGQTVSVKITGPAVWMGSTRFRRYVADSRNLPVCQENLEEAVTRAVAANDRAIRARDIAKTEFDLADEEDAIQVQLIAEQAVRIDDLADKVQRRTQQRNVAWGIAGGFLAASTAAVVLSLD